MDNFSQGLLETGITVIDMGIVPTPANYFSMFNMDIDGAVQITGSHNPSEFNGFKLSYNKGAFYGDQIQKLKGRIFLCALWIISICWSVHRKTFVKIGPIQLGKN